MGHGCHDCDTPNGCICCPSSGCDGIASWEDRVCQRCKDITAGKPVVLTLYRVLLDREYLYYKSKRLAMQHEDVKPFEMRALYYQRHYWRIDWSEAIPEVLTEYRSGAKARALAKLSNEDKRALGLKD